jgi:hypothetical protein
MNTKSTIALALAAGSSVALRLATPELRRFTHKQVRPAR